MIKGYPIPQIALHRGVALPIRFQRVFGASMDPAWRAVRQGTAADLTTMVRAHILVGIAVLALLAWYGGITALADGHRLAKPLFIVLIGLQVLAARWHHLVRKDGLIGRMVRAGGSRARRAGVFLPM